jgi:TRAP-type C4-dicarboxylate transport system permease small subunit
MADNGMFEKMGQWLRGLLVIYVALLAVESAADLVVTAILTGAGQADLSGGQGQAIELSLMTMGYSAYAQVAAFIVIAILFLRLLYKVAKQAKSFATPFTYVSPGWAVGYWFIPIMNLYRPFQVVKALFAACAQETGGDAKPAAGEQLLGAWWALFLVSNMAGWALARMDTDFSDRSQVITYCEYSLICNLLLIAATLLFWQVIKRLVMAIGRSGAARTLPGGPRVA